MSFTAICTYGRSALRVRPEGRPQEVRVTVTINSLNQNAAGRTADADSQRPLDLTLAPLGACHGGLSDARVTREGPTISDVYYHKSTRCGGGVAPAIVSGYKTCLRADFLHRSPITVQAGICWRLQLNERPSPRAAALREWAFAAISAARHHQRV